MANIQQNGSQNTECKEALKDYSTFSLYNIDEMTKHLTGLALATFTPSLDQELYSTCKQIPVENSSVDQCSLSISHTMTCSTCNTVFANRNEQTLHYKLDWHRFNIKLKLHGKRPVPENEFDDLAGDISSLSGSDSSSDDERSDNDTNGSDSCGNAHYKRPSILPSHVKIHRRRQRLSGVASTDSETEDSECVEKNIISQSRLQPKLYLKNQIGKIIALYRCVVHGKENTPQNEHDLFTRVAAVPNQMSWAIILVGGGHFAAAVYNLSEIKLHKTFHRYTVRAKQGSSQGTRDSKHGVQPKSAGASLRRHNEAALIKDVQDHLNSWYAELQKCNCIFYRAPSFNRVVLFGGKNPPFKKNDPRLRNIPFPTRRATFNEVKRVFGLLSTLECFGEKPDSDKTIPQSPKIHLGMKKAKKHSDLSSPEKISEINKKTETSNIKERTKMLIRKIKQESPVNSKESKDLSEDCVTSCTSDSDNSIKFEFVDEHIVTSDLKETGGTHRRKPYRKKGKQRSSSLSKRQQDPSSAVLSDEKCNMKNALFLACRSGDLEALGNLLDIIKNEQHLDKPDSNILVAKIDNNDICNVKFNQTFMETDNPSVTHWFDTGGSKQCVQNKGNIPIESNNIGQLENNSKSSLKRINLFQSVTPEHKIPNKESANIKIQQKWNKNPGRENFHMDALTLNILNDAISDSGATMLHVATKEGHQQAVRMLLECGADPTIRDKRGLTPYMTSNNREMRNEFRRFMAENPERFDYNKAQIPSPLTEEMQKEQMEKRKEKKKVKREKLKEKKAAELQKKLEEDEKKRFLALSDREKRALAAEKRFMKQLSSIGESTPILNRCFQCGENITGKVPFEYNNNCFCSVKCVKTHRKQNSHIS